MPFFQIIKAQEALVEYAGVFEAENAYSAYLKAATWKGLFDTDWVDTGIISEYDHVDILEDRTQLLDAETFEEAVKEIHEAYDFVDLRVTDAQRELISSALLTYMAAIGKSHADSPAVIELYEEIHNG